MKTDWQTKKLGEVCNFQNGFAFKSKFFTEKGLPILRISNIQQDKISYNRLAYFQKENYDIDFERYKVKKGDLVIAMSGATTGKLAVSNADETFYLNQRVGKFKPKENLSKEFLYYFLTTKVEENLKISLGSAQPNLSTEQIYNFQIPLPPLPTQTRIVAKLDTIFEKAQKAKENAEKNLANAKELFESYLQNLKGTKEPLGKLVDIKTGKLNANAAKEDGQYPFFTCSREVYAIDIFAFDCEAILLAGNNAVGDFNVKHYKGKFNAYQRTYVITINEENKIIYRFLYYQLLRSLKEFKQKSVGAGTRFLKLGMIQDLKILLPPKEEQKSIVAHLDTLSEQTKKLEKIYQQKLNNLEELKKSVLHEAFSGKL